MYYVNENIKSCVRIFPEQGRYGFLRCDMNENPEGLPEDFVKRVLAEITPEFLSAYPEPDEFLRSYARYIGADFDNLAALNGSDMAIRFAYEAFARPGADVVTVSPTFEMYAVNCRMLGLVHRPVSYRRDLTVSADDVIDAITPRADLVALLNPNNPVGDRFSRADCERIIDRAAECGAIVLIDEAYHYFCPETLLDLALKRDNVILLRTFSKLFSMAALRLGVAIGPPELIKYINNARPSFEVNAVALKFAQRAIEEPGLVERLIESHREGRDYLVDELKRSGRRCVAGEGNFLFIEPFSGAKNAERALRERGVLVKAYGSELLKRYIRVTTGPRAAMERFWLAFLDADK